MCCCLVGDGGVRVPEMILATGRGLLVVVVVVFGVLVHERLDIGEGATGERGLCFVTAT